MAPLGEYGATVAVAHVDTPVDAARAGQRGVLEDMAVHLCWLVQVAGRVVLYSRERETVEVMRRQKQPERLRYYQYLALILKHRLTFYILF